MPRLRTSLTAALAAAALAATGAPAHAEPVPTSCSVSVEWDGCTYIALGAIGTLRVDVVSGDAYGIVTCTYGGTGLWQYGPGSSSIEFIRAGYCVAYFTGPAVATVTSS